VKRAGPFLAGLVALYFVIALEVLVMISPFAGLFYAAFNPVLLFLARSRATGWLCGFFLPHMVSPPGALLRAVRVAGSALFLLGAAGFLVNAAQVYWSKLRRGGPVVVGAYRIVRHPQYLSLAACGLGLTILWPRFLTAALWAVMVALYYALARDEERRMTGRFGEAYLSYAAKTGMFLPAGLERRLALFPGPRSGTVRVAFCLAAALSFSVGGAFALRAYTVRRLPIWSAGPVSALPLLPTDLPMVRHRMAGVLELPEVRRRLPEGAPVLAYVLPVEYVMQGMIADTGEDWRLYQHHQSWSMIADWILHPFRHLEGGHAALHHGASGMAASAVRRIIFVRVNTRSGATSPAALLDLSAERTPLFMADVDLHELFCQEVRDLGPGTGWGDVPTPMF